MIGSLDAPREFTGKSSSWAWYLAAAPFIAILAYIPIWIYFSFDTAFILFCVSLLILCPLGVVMVKQTARRDERAYERYYHAAAFIDRLQDIVFRPYKYVGSIKPETLPPKAAARYHTIKDALNSLTAIDRHGFNANVFAEWEAKYISFLHLVDPSLRADADPNELYQYPNKLRDEILSIEDAYVPQAITRLSAYQSFITALMNTLQKVSGSMSEETAKLWQDISEAVIPIHYYLNEHLHVMRLTNPPPSTPPHNLPSFYTPQLHEFFYGQWKHLKDIRPDQRYTIADLSPDVETYDRAMSQATHHQAIFQAVISNPADWYTQFQLVYEPLKAAYDEYVATSGLFQLGTTADIPQPDPNTLPPYVIDLSPSERRTHTYVIGRTGSGKTTLLKNLITQDLRNPKQGLIVISPENKIFEDLLDLLPPERANDLIYFDPTDTRDPVIGFNPFTFEAGDDINQKAQETYTIFERALGELGVKMTTLLQNAAYALIQRHGSRLIDLDTLLHPSNNSLRHRVARDPKIDERTRNFWQSFDTSSYYKSAYEPIVNRLDPFFRPPHATILSTNSFSWDNVLNTRPHIIFCNLSRLKGVEAQIMGQLLIAQIQLTIFHRDPKPESTYIPYALYIDEFQTYATTSEQSFIETLNKARKYHFAMTLAHQVTSDIPSKLLSSIVGNVGTVMALRVSAEDAPFFTKDLQIKDGEGHARPDILQNLPLGQALARTPSHNHGIAIAVPPSPPPAAMPSPDIFTPLPADSYTTTLKMLSKRNYGTQLSTQPQQTDIVPQEPISEATPPLPADDTAPAITSEPKSANAATIVIDETENPLTRTTRRRGRPPKTAATDPAPAIPRRRRTPKNGDGETT